MRLHLAGHGDPSRGGSAHVLHMRRPTTWICCFPTDTTPLSDHHTEPLRSTVTSSEYRGEPFRVLVVGDGDWWVRSNGATLGVHPFETMTAATIEDALQHLVAWRPEGAVVDSGGEAGAGLEMVATLRREGLGVECPIILVTEQPLSRDERLLALRSGAWDCLDPASGDDLALKMQAYLRATRVASIARHQALLDEASGLYNAHGILRWARELRNAARRHGRPLGCAVFASAAVDPARAHQATSAALDDESGRIALRLTNRGRGSDIVGRLSPHEYIVLAPDAGPEGIVAMAHRFVLDDETGSTEDIRLRAGCFAVDNVATESVEPADLIGRASLALRRARSSDSEPVEFFSGPSAIAN